MDSEKKKLPDVQAYCSVGDVIIGFETMNDGYGSIYFAVIDELPRINVQMSRLQEPVTF